MDRGLLIIMLLFFLGLVIESNSLFVGAGIIMLLKLFHLDDLLPLFESKGVEIGLIFLMLAILTPLARDQISFRDLSLTFRSLPGLLALFGGIVATRLNGMGLELLQKEPQIIVGLIIGSIIGIVALGGIPVGPLMPGGIAAFLLFLIKFFSR
ncbi:MAG: DUF441 domain-containing protein [Dethiobacteria bacterium]|jgi:uncharacterized membrane protein (DUF441 family)|nr:DUF441 domain-containing protein [Bacillota bacterium]